jgi:hypothetical protein
MAQHLSLTEFTVQQKLSPLTSPDSWQQSCMPVLRMPLFLWKSHNRLLPFNLSRPIIFILCLWLLSALVQDGPIKLLVQIKRNQRVDEWFDKCTCLDFFLTTSVLFVRREQNCEAHNLACLGLVPSVSSFSGFADESSAI